MDAFGVLDKVLIDKLRCVGASATLAGSRTEIEQRKQVAQLSLAFCCRDPRHLHRRRDPWRVGGQPRPATTPRRAAGSR